MALILDGTSGASLVQPAVITQAALGPNVVGNGPCFSAYMSAAQSITNSFATKVAFNTLLFDTNSNFNTSLNRFTPTVAGYYSVAAICRDLSGAGVGQNTIIIYKNSTAYSQVVLVAAGSGTSPAISSIIFMNGSSDYLEVFYFQSSGGTTQINNSQVSSNFQAAMIRSA